MSHITKSELQNLAMVGGLKVEGKESVDELYQAIFSLVQAWRDKEQRARETECERNEKLTAYVQDYPIETAPY